MGCPSKNVASSGSGAGLIRTPELAQDIIQATRRAIDDWAGGQTLEAVGFKSARIAAIHRLNERRLSAAPVLRRAVPLSVKTRLGYDSVIVERWIEQLLQERPAAISLHGRTLQQMYRGAADWDAIGRAASLVKGTGTLLLGNGDVQTLAEVVRRVRETGADGVLVGRSALGAPWFFKAKEQVRAFACSDVNGRTDVPTHEPNSLAERFQLVLDHARQFEALYGPGQFHRMRKHLGWYCKAFPGAAALRGRMFHVSSVNELQTVIADYHAQHIVGSEADSIHDASTLTSRCS